MGVGSTCNLNLALRGFALILFIYLTETDLKIGIWYLPFSLTLILGVLLPSILYSKILWSLGILLLSLELFDDYYAPGNHHFLLIYTSMMWLQVLSQKVEERENFLRIVSERLIIVVLFMAALQKLLSPTFVSGDYIGYTLLRGQLFSPIYYLVSAYKDWIDSNYLLLQDFFLVDPNSGNKVMIPVGGNFSLFSKILSFSIFAIELLVVSIFLGAKENKTKHIALLVLIISIALSRYEFGFLGLLCTLGLSSARGGQNLFRLIYVVLLGLFVTLISTGVGFS